MSDNPFEEFVNSLPEQKPFSLLDMDLPDWWWNQGEEDDDRTPSLGEFGLRDVQIEAWEGEDWVVPETDSDYERAVLDMLRAQEAALEEWQRFWEEHPEYVAYLQNTRIFVCQCEGCGLIFAGRRPQTFCNACGGDLDDEAE